MLDEVGDMGKVVHPVCSSSLPDRCAAALTRDIPSRLSDSEFAQILAPHSIDTELPIGIRSSSLWCMLVASGFSCTHGGGEGAALFRGGTSFIVATAGCWDGASAGVPGEVPFQSWGSY